MARNFRDEDEGKRVVDSEGNEVGVISLIEGDEDGDDVEVDRSGSETRITDGLMELLGWERDADRGRLRGEHVDRIDEEAVYIRGEERDPENEA